MEDINLSDPEFLLRNLNLTHTDEEGLHYLTARESLAQTIALQIAFYTLCALKAFVIRERFPRIILIGTGFIGSRVLQQLIEFGCTPLLRVLCRDDSKFKLGIKSSNAIQDLVRGNDLDIIILCTPVSEFPNICRELQSLITKQTCIISASFGLKRHKIYNTLKTPCIFRTFIEPREILSNTFLESDASFSSNLKLLVPAEVCLAGRFIVERSIRIENLVFILENFYHILGMSRHLSRHEALKSIFGGNNSYGMPVRSKVIETAIEDGWASTIMRGLQERCGVQFQWYFSSAIRVVDLPAFDAPITASSTLIEDQAESDSEGDEGEKAKQESLLSDAELRAVFKLDDDPDSTQYFSPTIP